MKFLFDLLPVLLFFITFKLVDIYVATAVAIVITVLQVAWLKLRRQPVPGMLWAALAIVVVFGGATLVLQNEMFIKWKPTVLYWLFAAALAGSGLLRRNLVRAVLSQEMRLPEAIWRRLNWSWAGFFAFMGGANLYVAYNYATDTWVNFKLFGGFGLMLVFVVVQAMFLARYVEEKH